MHVEFHKVVKLIKKNKIYELYSGKLKSFTRLSYFPSQFSNTFIDENSIFVIVIFLNKLPVIHA